MRVGLAGGTLSYRDQELTLNRNGRGRAGVDGPGLLAAAGRERRARRRDGDRGGDHRQGAGRAALSGERERLAQLFEQAPGFMAVLRGPEHRFELVNPSYLRLVAHRPVLGRTVAEALPEAASQGYVSCWTRSTPAARRSPPTARATTCRRRPAARPRSAMSTSCSSRSATSRHRQRRLRRRRRRHRPGRWPSGAAKRWSQLADAFRDLRRSRATSASRRPSILGETLAVSRVGYGTIDPEAETLHVRRDWNAPGVETPRRRAAPARVRLLHREPEGQRVHQHRRRARRPAHRGGGRRRWRRAARARSSTCRWSSSGRLVAVLYVNHDEVREWTTDDLALIREVAERTRTAVERARSQAPARERGAPARGQRDAGGEGARRAPAS